MLQPDTPSVPGLLLRGLRELRDNDDRDWDSSIGQLVDELVRVPRSSDEVLREVVSTSALLQQFLLELAVRPSAGRPTTLIFDTLAVLLQQTVEYGDANAST